MDFQWNFDCLLMHLLATHRMHFVYNAADDDEVQISSVGGGRRTFCQFACRGVQKKVLHSAAVCHFKWERINLLLIAEILTRRGKCNEWKESANV